MRPSPIQLKEMVYLGIKVWPQLLEETDGQVTAASFDFNGVMIGERIEVQILGEEDNPMFYGVKLRISVENKEGKIAPYDLDVEVAGVFEIINKKIKKEEREEMVTVNGCAVLYSAIRDQIMTLTARSVRGALILPTVNFQDKVEKKTDAQLQGSASK